MESELAQLPPEDEVQRFAMEQREQQQELDAINDEIKKMEDKLGDGSDGNDDDETPLVRKIREVNRSNEQHERELEQEQPLAKQNAFKLTTEEVKLAISSNDL